ncbi:MAG: phosphopantetheine-binding protein [Pseudomonadota bacterium]|nr:phosphopantetheine-binding protein [Pseudomonadota bacterium]
MNRSEIVSKLKALIEEEAQIKIESEDQELDIDSFTMMLVITYVKEEFDIELDLDKLDFDIFNSLNTFADLVTEEASELSDVA